MMFFNYDIGYSEIHGMNRKDFEEYCGEKNVEKIVRAQIFGSCSKDTISKMFDSYKYYLERSLNNSHMGTEENILTILSKKFKDEVEMIPQHELSEMLTND